jgi:predicted Na+-dependent transporter
MSGVSDDVRARWRTAGWLAAGAALPAASAAALVSVRGTVANTDIALLITGVVMVVATSGQRSAAAVAALSAAMSFDYFHTLPYHSLTIANRNDALATLVLGLLALAVGQIAARAADAHIELVLVVGAAVLSQAVPQPARFLVDHRGLDASLAVLVFATALAIPPSTFRGLAASAGHLIAALAAAAVVLPAMSWAVSRIVPTLALRRGVLTAGLAPAEIASVATTSLAGGDSAIAAGMLVGSTLVTVAAAGVGLRLLGGGGTVHLVPLLTNLGLVVGAPMVAGIAIRTRLTLSDRQEGAAERVSVAVVTLLVWLVASQVRLSSSYFAVAAALLLFLAGSAVLGGVLGLRAPAPVATALLLTTSMRDFAIAAGIAVAAFGAASAAPLGLYGVMVISWGMAVATLRSTRSGPTHPSHGLASLSASPIVAPSDTNPAALASLSIPKRPQEPATFSAITTATAEAELSGLVTLLRPGGPRLAGFVARAALDALSATPLHGSPTPQPLTLGVIWHSPSGLSLGVVEHADERRLQALDHALAAPVDPPRSALNPVPLWLSDNSSQGVSTALAVPDAAVLSIGVVRGQPRIDEAIASETIATRSVVTLTLTISYPTTNLEHDAAIDFLLHVVNSIQTRNWSAEL